MKVWSKTVNAKAINDSGIISLNIYHTDRSQTELISRAVAYTLQTKHGLYHGGGDKVSIKIIDEPIVSNYPVKPNLVLNFGLALILSLIFSCTYIYFFPEEEYNIKFPSIKRKIKTDSLEKPESSLYVSEPLVESVEENFSEPENNFIDQPVEESFAEPENNFNENLNNLNNNFDKYDDLEIREEIAKEGSMKNIFGKPYSDDF